MKRKDPGLAAEPLASVLSRGILYYRKDGAMDERSPHIACLPLPVPVRPLTAPWVRPTGIRDASRTATVATWEVTRGRDERPLCEEKPITLK